MYGFIKTSFLIICQGKLTRHWYYTF